MSEGTTIAYEVADILSADAVGCTIYDSAYGRCTKIIIVR